MEPMMAAAGLLALGALSPGPNNLMVLRASAESGWRGALPASAGIVLGGLALLGAVVAGAGALLAADPRLATPMTLAAAALLAAQGASVLARPDTSARRGGEAGPAAGAGRFGWLFLFQFLNPKAWLLVLAAVTAIGSPPPPGAFVDLAALFALISTLGLTLWALGGAGLARHLARGRVQVWFDRLTGATLLGFAALLLRGAGAAG